MFAGRSLVAGHILDREGVDAVAGVGGGGEALHIWHGDTVENWRTAIGSADDCTCQPSHDSLSEVFLCTTVAVCLLHRSAPPWLVLLGPPACHLGSPRRQTRGPGGRRTCCR